FLGALPLLSLAPRGDGHPVLVLPGLVASDTSTRPLRAFLRGRGYAVSGWRQGRNLGLRHGVQDAMVDLLQEMNDTHGRKVSLVGWSLGGVLARGVARRHPDAVRRVITYGTPLSGGAAHTTFARTSTSGDGTDTERVARRVRPLAPIDVPVTVLFSRRDGIVSWRACLDHTSPAVEHVEVSSTHIGMGVDPDVWAVVADRLAKPAGPAQS
ncbi:MAG TPA: alpha/beta hydrolase, partial [Nocardioides sp.]